MEVVKYMKGVLAGSGNGACEGKYLDVSEMREDYSVAYSPEPLTLSTLLYFRVVYTTVLCLNFLKARREQFYIYI